MKVWVTKVLAVETDSVFVGVTVTTTVALDFHIQQFELEMHVFGNDQAIVTGTSLRSFGRCIQGGHHLGTVLSLVMKG